MTPTEFTPLASTIGGALIGVASVMLMLFSGRIAGISGIIGRLFPPFAGADPRGAAAFVIGLIAALLLYAAATGSTSAQTVSDNASLMAVAGLLVGFGGPVLAECFSLPTAKKIDARVIAGPALFGIGWGLSGFCPGPAITSLALLAKGTLVFVSAMLIGIWLARRDLTLNHVAGELAA